MYEIVQWIVCIIRRGARIARRDERAYRPYVSEEQRREAGCPARNCVANHWDGTLGQAGSRRWFG